jgi:hypothetical protein
MQRPARAAKPAAIQILVVAVGLAVLLGAYLVAAHLAMDVAPLSAKNYADRRDLAYFLIHVGALVVALLVGFGLGKWLSGLGVAFALLFVVIMGVTMVSVQVGSFQLACDGHNDLVRHWTC